MLSLVCTFNAKDAMQKFRARGRCYHPAEANACRDRSSYHMHYSHFLIIVQWSLLSRAAVYKAVRRPFVSCLIPGVWLAECCLISKDAELTIVCYPYSDMHSDVQRCTQWSGSWADRSQCSQSRLDRSLYSRTSSSPASELPSQSC